MEGVFNQQQLEQFITNGFIRVDNAFDAALAEQVRSILWKDMGVDPHDRSTWTRPVVRLGWYSQEPFVNAANTEVLRCAYNQLVGEDRWVPVRAMGSFPVRFPSDMDPGDTGWHVDASFPGADPHDFMSYRVNFRSRGRALLMLFLFSDVGERDAPTKISVGSHRDVARLLSKEGDDGLGFMDLARHLDRFPKREEIVAVGKAGTVFLCHPFLVHAAQPHRGTEPRFLAQPALSLKGELDLDRVDGKCAPVEEAILRALRE